MNLKDRMKSRFMRVEQTEEDESNQNALDEMNVFILDESNRIRHTLRPLISDFFGELDVHVNYGAIDSEERFQRFTRNISVDIELFVLTTRSEYRSIESSWEKRYEKLIEHNRVKNILILCDEEHLEDVFQKTQENKRTFLFIRTTDVSRTNKLSLMPCLNQIKRAIYPE